MDHVLVKTDFQFPRQKKRYQGKVRDVYFIDERFLVMVATDRISAFDVVLPRGIPYKGQVLNQIASEFLNDTADIVPSWKIASPDPMVTIGYWCQPFPVEMIIRGYLTGSSWRSYRQGSREICGVKLSDGLREHQKFEEAIITPTTKAESGHDEDISRQEIIEGGLISEEDYLQIEHYTRELFRRGSQIAENRGLILVDTKYEFGKRNGRIYLIDEIHTPDSSRYFYLDGYEERFRSGAQQHQLSKEFVREWLMQQGFQGKEGQKIPFMPDSFVKEVSERYIELYERITGKDFILTDTLDVEKRVEHNIMAFLESIL
ncbi:MAG: phosphoribosylaminoimidazolesuccinocarboxamide synthase [Bacteroidales bacterium]|nr:phosphoribosylaminoimidazolesuccinocarboxamide synthase [Bacteroidales bacterium]